MTKQQANHLDRRIKHYIVLLWHDYKSPLKMLRRNVLYHLLFWQIVLSLCLLGIGWFSWMVIANHIGDVNVYLRVLNMYRYAGMGLWYLNVCNLAWLLAKRTISLKVPWWWILAIMAGFIIANMFDGGLRIVLFTTMALCVIAIMIAPDADADNSLTAEFGPESKQHKKHYIIKDLTPDHDEQDNDGDDDSK